MDEVPQRVSPPFERMTQLTQDTVGDGFVHSVGLWTPVLWHEIGPEQLVPKRQEGGVVRPNRIPFVGVVPVVEFGRDDEAVQPLESPSHVGVEEQSENKLSSG